MNLIENFVELNVKMTQEYVSISEWLKNYTTLDLLSNREFHPVFKELSQRRIDLFLVLSACMGLYLRMSNVEFESLQFSLNKEENRVILRSESKIRNLPKYQKVADRAVSRYLEASLLSLETRSQSTYKSLLN